MPAAIAIPAVMGAVGIGTSVAGGLMGASAAKSAAAGQAAAAQQAGQKVVDTTNQVNPGITTAASDAGKLVTDTTSAAATGVEGATSTGQAGVTAAAGKANDLLDPYIKSGADATGTLRTLLQTGGDLNRTFTADDFKSLDPGFNFRLQQAQQALARSAAARGGSLGGGAAKELDRYSQDYGSSEFQNAFQRFETNANDRYNRLSGVAGMGLNASTTAGKDLIDAGEFNADLGLRGATTAGGMRTGGAEFAAGENYDAAKTTANNSINASKAQGEYLTQGANATAAGKVGAANAYGGMLGGIGNAVTGAISLRQMLQNPSLNPYGAPTPYSGTRTNPDGSLTVMRGR